MTDRLIHIPVNDRLGRSLIHHDDRSKNFRAVDILRGAVAEMEPRNRTWRRGAAYDQIGPRCVAYTGKGMLNTKPLSTPIPYRVRSKYDPFDFYDGAQRNDEWPAENYDGTSGLGLCRYLLAKGLIKEYRWCFGLNDVLLTVSHIGPVGLGSWWYTGMFYPGERGLIEATGSREGGHEVEINGVDVDREEVVITQSWGTDHGVNGRVRMKWTTLDRLLGEQGDAFVVLQ